MSDVLLGQLPDQRRRQGDPAAVLAHGAAEDLERIVLLPRLVVPAFDGDGREVNLAAADRVSPGLGGESLEGGLEFSCAGGELSSGPTTEKRKRAHKGAVEDSGFLVIRSPRESGENDWKTTLRPDYFPPPRCSKSIFCGGLRIIAKSRASGPRWS